MTNEHGGEGRLLEPGHHFERAWLLLRWGGDSRVDALRAADALWRYLQTSVRGSWHDRLMSYGRFIEEPAPASSFYHVVGAIAELSACLNSKSSAECGSAGQGWSRRRAPGTIGA